MSLVEILAALAGLAVVSVVAGLRPDPGTDWEGRAALGFLGAIVGGPLWIAQGVLTLLGGHGWLWGWWVGAPLLGMLVPRGRRRSAAPPG